MRNLIELVTHSEAARARVQDAFQAAVLASSASQAVSKVDWGGEHSLNLDPDRGRERESEQGQSRSITVID